MTVFATVWLSSRLPLLTSQGGLSAGHRLLVQEVVAKAPTELRWGNELVLQLTDDEFIVLVKASPGESAVDLKPKDTDRRQTNLVAIIDFKEFTTTTRVLTFGQ